MTKRLPGFLFSSSDLITLEIILSYHHHYLESQLFNCISMHLSEPVDLWHRPHSFAWKLHFKNLLKKFLEKNLSHIMKTLKNFKCISRY